MCPSTPSGRWKVGWRYTQTFLGLHSKTALQHSPKQLTQMETASKKTHLNKNMIWFQSATKSKTDLKGTYSLNFLGLWCWCRLMSAAMSEEIKGVSFVLSNQFVVSGLPETWIRLCEAVLQWSSRNVLWAKTKTSEDFMSTGVSRCWVHSHFCMALFFDGRRALASACTNKYKCHC